MVITYLEHINGFMDFCRFNHIYEETLNIICPYLRLENIQKGGYLFHFGESSKTLYLLLKGKISIRVPKNSKTHEQDSTFGEDIIKNNLSPRKLKNSIDEKSNDNRNEENEIDKKNNYK